MAGFLNTLCRLFGISAAPQFITVETVRKANARLMMGDQRPPMSPEVQEILRKHPITSESLARAGSHALQKVRYLGPVINFKE